MARDDPQFRIRLPEDLKSQIQSSADANHRSLNAEIIFLLEKAIKEPRGIPLSHVVPELSEEEVSDMMRVFERAHLRTRDGKR